MNNKIYFSESCFEEMPFREPKQPRTRYVKYYQDLYALHNITLSPETYLTGSQYTYAELGNKVLKKYAETEQLYNMDLLHIVTWTHEFDPDYASTGAYFVDKFKLKCLVYDIGDHGSLAFFTSVDLIKKYLSSSQLQKACILVMEQTSVPRNKSSKVLLPPNNFAFALMLNKKIEETEIQNIYEIMSAGICHNVQVKSFKNICADIVNNFISQREDILLICKKEGMIYQKYQLEKNKLSQIKLKTITNYPGNYTLLIYLRDLLKQHVETENVLMIDEDAETDDIGYLLLRRSGHASSV